MNNRLEIVMTERPFTPRKSYDTNERYAMRLSDADRSKVGRGRWPATDVTDLNTGTRYRVRSASCGLRCFCDAVVTRTYAAEEAA